ncbi:MAG TPA: hypothetical protein VHE35_04375 [Kofleriaceae bacterium]|nr:hypothetical protein [Kofleriaceae bacterium]
MRAKSTVSTPGPVQVGDLVTAAFDAAAKLGRDARETSRLATEAVAHLLRHARTAGSHRTVH